MTANPEFQHATPEGARPVEVYRVKAGQSVTMRMLSERIDGCQTHYIKNRSHYCLGDAECPPQRHKEELVWKGYVAAEYWEQASGLWIPAVLEISERFERDVRLIYERGQVWELFKRPQVKRDKHPPLEGRRLQDTQKDLLPLAFEILPTLEVLYKCPGLQLGIQNPLAPRVMVAPSTGLPPKRKGMDGDGPILTRQEQQEYLKAARERGAARAAREERNGNAKQPADR